DADEDQAEADEDLLHRALALYATQQHGIDQRAESGGDQRRQHERRPERSGEMHEGEADEGAQHIERAVSEIDEIHQAEDDREADRQQKEQHRVLQPVEELDDERRGIENHGCAGPVYRPPSMLSSDSLIAIQLAG